MSETKHTPGPWAAVHNEHYWQISSKRDGQIGDACASDYIYHNGVQIDSTEIAAANARLLAAAPDLLAELVKMRGRFYAALVSTGTDAEFASAAVADADLAIKRATEA